MNVLIANAVPIITALTGLFGVLLGIIGVILTFVFNQNALKQKAHEEEQSSIYHKINTFYGPFQQLRGESQELYKIFRSSQGEDFRALTALLQGKKFEGNDKVLLEQLIDISKKSERLIIKHSGLIDDEELRQLLSVASTHFRLMQLASKGVITGNSERFKNYVFPQNLDDKVIEEIAKLKRRLEEIKSI